MPPAKTAETAEDWLAKEIQKDGMPIPYRALVVPRRPWFGYTVFTCRGLSSSSIFSARKTLSRDW